MKARYIGPSATGIDLPLPTGRFVHVAQGAELPLEVPEWVVASLLEQTDNFEPVEAPAKAPARGTKEN